MHHSILLICTQGLLGTAQHLCQGTWTRSTSGIVLSTTAPPLSPKELISLAAQNFPPSAAPHWAGSPGEGQEGWVLV